MLSFGVMCPFFEPTSPSTPSKPAFLSLCVN